MEAREFANHILKMGWGVIVPHLIHEDEILDNFGLFLKEITSKGYSVNVQHDISGLAIKLLK